MSTLATEESRKKLVSDAEDLRENAKKLRGQADELREEARQMQKNGKEELADKRIAEADKHEELAKERIAEAEKLISTQAGSKAVGLSVLSVRKTCSRTEAKTFHLYV